MAQQVYLNPMQRDVLSVGAKNTIVVAGRGTGKGMLHAAIMLRNFQQMPGSTTAIVGPTIKGVLTNTLPSMLEHWEHWGYKQGIHYVVGIKPPKSLRWDEPLYKPEHWDNFISFYNGAIGQIITQDRQGTSNSKSFDFIDVDEAKFVNFDKLKSETMPANRGQVKQFGHLSFHHGMLITSDMPLTKRGSWFLNYKKNCDPELVAAIRSLTAELQYYQKVSNGSPHYERTIRPIKEMLDKLRRRCTFFGVYPSLCNIEILGEEWFHQMARDLPRSEYRTSILCREETFQRDGFYSSMGERHLYRAADFHYMDSLGYDMEKLKQKDCRMDGDIQPDAPLCLAFDYNSNINCLVVGQPDEDRRRLNVINSFFVKYGRKLPELVQDFCKYYAYHKTKEAILYYDTTALSSNYAVNDQDFLFVISRELEKGGWMVRQVFIGNPMRHMEKHLLINRGFAGKARLIPFFNEENNQSLLASMTDAGVYGGKKDKRGEKLAETEESPLETRTDFSDAFDTLYIGCERFPQGTVISGVTSDF